MEPIILPAAPLEMEILFIFWQAKLKRVCGVPLRYERTFFLAV